MTTRDVHVGATTLAVTEVGDGPAVVFLHGFPLSARMWEHQLASLPSGWRGVAPDLRGFARSSGTPSARHVTDHASDVLGLIDAVGGPVVLVGLSMGGYIAFECWRQRPAAIRALVLADTRAEGDSDEARAKRGTLQRAAAEQGSAAVIDAMLPNLLGETTQATDPHLAVQLRQWALESRAEGVIDALEVLKTRPDSRPTLGTITCPTLVIVGEEDTLTPRAVAQVMADGIPGAQLVRIPLAGHMSNLEQPEAFTRALGAFLHAV